MGQSFRGVQSKEEIKETKGEKMKIIDLTVPLYSGMDVYPGDPKVSIRVKHTHDKEGWELRKITMGSHTGTHVDAFSHMHPHQESIDQMPLDRFFGPAQRVEKSGIWPSGMGLFFTEEITMDDFTQLLQHQPNFVGGVMSEDLERALLKEDIVTYTDLVNVECLPLRTTFTFYGVPLKIQDGDGSPVRAFAIVE